MDNTPDDLKEPQEIVEEKFALDAPENNLPRFPSPPPLKLLKKLAAAIADVGQIPKKGENTFDKYFYSTEEDIVLGANKAMIKQKIITVPEYVGHTRKQQLSSQGKNEWFIVLTVDWLWLDAETGESFYFRAIGEAADRGDKAINKAWAASRKINLLETLSISRGGDDPENPENDRKQQQLAPPQRQFTPNKPETKAAPAETKGKKTETKPEKPGTVVPRPETFSGLLNGTVEIKEGDTVAAWKFHLGKSQAWIGTRDANTAKVIKQLDGKHVTVRVLTTTQADTYKLVSFDNIEEPGEEQASPEDLVQGEDDIPFT